jgi:EAL domain-containing protein (putative c-di-GMP-specific phosphodiesterase class I)
VFPTVILASCRPTAEGVETPEQLEAVRSEGCGEVQGFYFSKPMPAGDIDRLYLSSRRATKRANSGSAA